MRRSSVAFAVVALSGSLLAAAPAEPRAFELTLEFSPASPRPGDRVFWLGRLRNASRETVQVPRRLPEWIHLHAHHQSPGDHGLFGFGVAHERITEVEWVPLGPGESIELGGDVGEQVEACRRGCPEGDLSMTLELAVPPTLPREGLLPNQVVPVVPPANAHVRLAPPSFRALERAAPGTVALLLRKARQVQGAVKVQVSLVNRTDAPLRVPVLDWLEAHCLVEGEGLVGGDWATASSEDPVWSEDDSRLLAPGRALDGTVTCIDTRLPTKGSLRLRLEQKGRFVPSRALVPPFVWTGDVTSEAIAVRRR